MDEYITDTRRLGVRALRCAGIRTRHPFASGLGLVAVRVVEPLVVALVLVGPQRRAVERWSRQDSVDLLEVVLLLLEVIRWNAITGGPPLRHASSAPKGAVAGRLLVDELTEPRNAQAGHLADLLDRRARLAACWMRFRRSAFRPSRRATSLLTAASSVRSTFACSFAGRFRAVLISTSGCLACSAASPPTGFAVSAASRTVRARARGVAHAVLLFNGIVPLATFEDNESMMRSLDRVGAKSVALSRRLATLAALPPGRPRSSAVQVHCSNCQEEIPPGLDRCRQCGSTNIMVGASTPGGTRISVARPAPESLTVGATVFRLSGKDEPAYKQGGRFLRHNIKVEYSRDRQQIEYVERIFDKVRGTYIERCYDVKTGAMTFDKEGPITDQTLHGRRGKHMRN